MVVHRKLYHIGGLKSKLLTVLTINVVIIKPFLHIFVFINIKMSYHWHPIAKDSKIWSFEADIFLVFDYKFGDHLCSAGSL